MCRQEETELDIYKHDSKAKKKGHKGHSDLSYFL